MPIVKVPTHKRQVKGKTITVKGFSFNRKSKPSKSGKPTKPRKKPTAAQLKARHDWYQKNKSKIKAKRKLKKHK